MVHLIRCMTADQALQPSGPYKVLMLGWQLLFGYVAHRMGVLLELRGGPIAGSYVEGYRLGRGYGIACVNPATGKRLGTAQAMELDLHWTTLDELCEAAALIDFQF